MLWYLLFCLLCLAAIVFNEWDSGEDLVTYKLVAFVVMSLFPVMNLAEMINAIFEIIERRFNGVILKGKK
jgi:hypothetical protein